MLLLKHSPRLMAFCLLAKISPTAVADPLRVDQFSLARKSRKLLFAIARRLLSPIECCCCSIARKVPRDFSIPPALQAGECAIPWGFHVFELMKPKRASLLMHARSHSV